MFTFENHCLAGELTFGDPSQDSGVAIRSYRRAYVGAPDLCRVEYAPLATQEITSACGIRDEAAREGRQLPVSFPISGTPWNKSN